MADFVSRWVGILGRRNAAVSGSESTAQPGSTTDKKVGAVAYGRMEKFSYYSLCTGGAIAVGSAACATLFGILTSTGLGDSRLFLDLAWASLAVGAFGLTVGVLGSIAIFADGSMLEARMGGRQIQGNV